MNKDGVYVVTTAFPFVPAQLNLAHFSSTYVPADIIYRYLKLFNYRAIQVNATDVHSFFASKDGISIDEKQIIEFDNKYNELYKLMHIDYDNYILTSDSIHIGYTQVVIRKLYEVNQLLTKESYSYFCEECKGFLPHKFVESKEIESCLYCGNNHFAKISSEHWWLRLKDKKEEIKLMIDSMILQEDVKNFLYSQLESIEDWDFTRDNKFGIPFPLDERMTIYLWFESLVGYYSLILKFGLKESEINFIHFFGKNIIYYHGIVWPVILRYAISNEVKIALSARGFWNEKESDNDLLDIENDIRKYDADYLRFYIAYKVTDNIKDFKFTRDNFIDVINQILIKKIVNLNYRVYCLLKKIDTIPSNDESINYFDDEIEQIEEKVKTNEVNGIVKIIIDTVNRYNRIISDSSRRDVSNKNVVIELAELSAFINVSLSAIMPCFIDKINIFEDYICQSYEDITSVGRKKIKKELSKIKIME